MLLIVSAISPPASASAAPPAITPFIAKRSPLSPNDHHAFLDRRQFLGDCVLACGALDNLEQCTGPTDSPEYKSCECSIFNSAGPVKVDICAACWAYFVPAAAAVLAIAGKDCAVAAGQVTTALAECSSQCAPIISGFGTCSSVQCLCPTVSVDGVGCSACLGPINTADAAFVASLMGECGVSGASSGGSVTASPGTGATGTAISTGTVVSTSGSTGLNAAGTSSSVTTASHSGGQGAMTGSIFGTSVVGICIYLTIVFGLVGVII